MINRSGALVTTLNPTFEGEYAKRFDSLCRDLAAINGKNPNGKIRREARFHEEIEWVKERQVNPVASQRYLTAVTILSDLLNLSWEIHYSPAGLELVSPAPKVSKGMQAEDIQEVKNGVRIELSESVKKQLEHPATQEFVRRMESPHDRSKHSQRISVLIADGQELTARLQPALDMPDDEKRIEALAGLVKPYLQLVDAEERDEFTGIKLGEIWRYFRLTWAIPSTNVPGRQLLYLIRDAAHPFHAVIGIAALSNSAMQVKDRDDFIGWTTQEYIKRFKSAVSSEQSESVEDLLALLEQHIEFGLQDIDSRGLVTAEEIAQPDEGVVNRLRTEIGRFSDQRKQELRTLDVYDDETVYSEIADAETDIPIPQVSDEMLALDTKVANEKLNPARRLLVFKKRAFELNRLLSARLLFQRLRQSPDLIGAIASSLHREEFQSAVNSALFANKRVRIGINMLELTTCGAIPPYSYLLGGKLVALLMMSPQVGAEYRARYGDKPSLILSQMRNEKVVRAADLVYLGTTSLYSAGSSQYNRVTLPAGTFHPDQPELRYRHIGYTSGFGTVQFSADTTRALTNLEMLEFEFRNVNSIFGEGFSPKLRKIRAGLASLGFDPEVMLRHNQPRMLYAVELYNNARYFLRGEDNELPSYITSPEQYQQSTESIANFWRQRWLAKRILRSEIMGNVRNFECFSLIVSPTLSSEEGKSANVGLTTKVEAAMPSAPVIPEPKVPSVSVEFVQRLYRDMSAYSDRLTSSQRNAINIQTPLEDYVLDKVKQGYSIILTGNAGDGKTHILTRLSQELEALDVRLILDASVVSADEILSSWQAALVDGVPFCMAANEWPLHILIQDYGDTFPLLQVVRDQIDQQLIYGDESNKVPNIDESRLIVIDLGKRNHLQKDFFKAALAAILRDNLHEQCPRCRHFKDCDAPRNRRLLANEQIAERLGILVDRLAAMGHHITVRELLSMLSYTIFGGRTCPTLFKTSKEHGFYSDQLFDDDAKGTIFELLKTHVDPASISHPHWDVQLYYNEAQEERAAWVEPDTVQLVRGNKGSSQERSAFDHVKRRFYFEHSRGNEILDVMSKDEQDFYRLVDPESTDFDEVLDDVLKAINLFFCPPLSSSDTLTKRLYVWTSHHYDERVPKAFLCRQRIERDPHLTIQRPSLAPHLIDAFAYHPDHVRLVVYPNSSNTRWLNIDYPLFKMLKDVQKGLPPILAPEEQSVRLYQFMNALQAVIPPSAADRHDVLSYVVGSQHILNVRVKKSKREIEFSELK